MVTPRPSVGSAVREEVGAGRTVLVVGHGAVADAAVLEATRAGRASRHVDAAPIEIGGDVDLVLLTEPIAPRPLRALHVLASAQRVRLGLVVASRLAGGPSRVLLCPRRCRPASGALMRVADVVGASFLLVVTAPLALAIAAAVRLDSRGPALFVQERIGRNGRRFRMWKFRTMRRDAVAYAQSPSDGHGGVTRLGRVLRPTGLDELPQLVNVLRGDMGLVGPRPEMPFVVDRYSARARERLSARPGITGMWQLYGDRGRAIHEQLEFDFLYLACRSTALDAWLLLQTAGYVLRAIARVVPMLAATGQVRRRESAAR